MHLYIGYSEKVATRILPTNWRCLTGAPLATFGAVIIDASDTATLIQLVASQLPLPTFIIGQIPINHTGQLTVTNIDTLNTATMAQITAVAQAYEQTMVPAFIRDLLDYAKADPTSFATPGHHSGTTTT